MQSHDGELAERLMVEEQLRESSIIDHQTQELSELRNRVHHGKNVSLLIREHLWELLTLHSSDSHKLHELLVSMYKLADRLILKLSPENGAEEESGKEDESLALRLSKAGQEEEEVKETLKDSLDEGHKSSFSHCKLSDIHQPLCSGADLLESQHNQKQVEEEEATDHRMEPQESEEMDEVLLDPLVEMDLNPSSCHNLPDSYQPPKSPSSLSEEHVDVDKSHENGVDNEEESLDCSSLDGEHPEEKEDDLLPVEEYFASSGHVHSSDSAQLPPSDETKVSSALDGAKAHLGTRLEAKNPPELEGDELEGSAVETPGSQVPILVDATTILTEKILKRKSLLLSKWNIACRFPGLQASENHENEHNEEEDSLNSSSLSGELPEEKEDDLLPGEEYFQSSGHAHSCDLGQLPPPDETKFSSALDGAKAHLGTQLEAKNPPELEGDELEGLAVETPGCQVPILIDATTVFTENVLKRKPLILSNWSVACRFPGLQALGRVVLTSVTLGSTYSF
ncbi:neuroblastoma breakpoint family member 20-like [Sciurus carolinensis]|uniref:neuroblastoma breakpoint family member 20-like n=1 Tax=Sciurus carolinensis TaxID=30640 RepID=UPI001FB330EB|nr:neuroblastoma breakpoint family member 20-like [Sciurus carolinensis]